MKLIKTIKSILIYTLALSLITSPVLAGYYMQPVQPKYRVDFTYSGGATDQAGDLGTFTQTYAGENRTNLNADGTTTTVGANTVRIDDKGLLLEPAAANLLFATRTFTAAAGWSLFDCTTVKDQVGIDGAANSATTFTDTSNSAFGILRRTVLKSTSDSTTLFQASISFKKTTGATSFPGLGVIFYTTATKEAFYTVNTDTGVLTAYDGNDVATIGYTIKSEGGFWRATVWAADNGANPNCDFRAYGAVNTDGSATWAAATQGSCVIDAGMLTTGAIPSSYFDGAAAIGSELVTGGDFTPIASGSVALADIKISAVDGTAFVDFSAADVLTDHIGKIVTIIDSAGKAISGYIKAAGTGETFGGELAPNVLFENTTNVGVGGCTVASIAGGEAGNCLEITRVEFTSQYAAETIGNYNGKLIKASSYVKSGTSGDELYALALLQTGDNLNTISGTSSGAWVKSQDLYATSLTDLRVRLVKFSATAGTMLFDTLTVKQVLTPSATGVTIVSAPGGTTYNWMFKDAAFNYNDASGYTYEIYDADWLYGTGWYPAGSKANKVAGTASALIQNAGATTGKVYRLLTTITQTAGTIVLNIDTTNNGSKGSSGSYVDYITYLTSGGIGCTGPRFYADATFVGTVDAVSVKEHGTVRLSEANTVTAAIPTALSNALQEALGSELATGTLTIGTLYKITASEVNHFYTGSAVNHYFTAAAATALDANNKVKEVTRQSKGTLVAYIMPSVARAAGVTGNILAATTAEASLLYRTTAAGNISASDGTNIAECTGAYAANTLGKWVLQWGAINSNVQQFRVGYSAINGSIAWGSYATYDGAFTVGANLIPGYTLHSPIWIGPLWIFPDGLLSDTYIDNNM